MLLYQRSLFSKLPGGSGCILYRPFPLYKITTAAYNSHLDNLYDPWQTRRVVHIRDGQELWFKGPENRRLRFVPVLRTSRLLLSVHFPWYTSIFMEIK